MTALADRTTVQLLEARGVVKHQLALDRSKLATPHGQTIAWLRARIRRNEQVFAQLQAEVEERGAQGVLFNRNPPVTPWTGEFEDRVLAGEVDVS